MYLPRSLISKLYLHLQQTRHPLSPPILLLVALEPDALCACRILTRMLKHDYIPHKIQPVAGYADLERAGTELVLPMTESRGGSGGIVVCLGVGGMIDLGTVLGLEQEEGQENPFGGVEIWVIDSHRPWNLGNIFGGVVLEPETEGATTFQARCPPGIARGCVGRAYKPGKGGIIVFDDGDIEEQLEKEKQAYATLIDMPEVEDDGQDLDGESDDESEDDEERASASSPRAGHKRKSWSDFDLDEDSEEESRPRQRRRSNSVSCPSLHPFFFFFFFWDISLTAALLLLTNRISVELHSRVSQSAATEGPPLYARRSCVFIERPCGATNSSAAP